MQPEHLASSHEQELQQQDPVQRESSEQVEQDEIKDEQQEEWQAPELRPRKKLPYSYVFKKTEPKDDEVIFECNICLDTASNPVVTLCGHLYCWSCLNQWMKSNVPTSLQCPVCKAGIKKESIIPIYVRGKEKVDPRDTDERPQGQRPEPTTNGFQSYFQGWNNQPGIRFQFGVFPFFPMGFQMGIGTEEDSSAFFSRMFLMIATLVLVSIILY